MTGVIILAAGESTRLGRPKQNLIYRGETLLQNAADAACACNAGPVIIVTGANEDMLIPVRSAGSIVTTRNDNWREGIGSSVSEGMRCLLKTEKSAGGVILMLCDQPFVNSRVLASLIEKKLETGKGIVASAYESTFGPPVLFDSKYFSNLLSLSGNEGAKRLLYQFRKDLTSVDFTSGATDIDTEEDYLIL